MMMPRSLRLALAQFNPAVGDIAGNSERIIALIGAARAAAADLVAFPELAVTGYPPEDLLLKPSFLADNAAAVRRIAAAAADIAVIVGCVAVGDDIANAAALIGPGRAEQGGTGPGGIGPEGIGPGRIAGWYRKIYLPNYGVFDEERYFRRGDAAGVCSVNGALIGVNICEDIWYPEGPIAAQRDAGAAVIVNINASPYHAGKARQRARMIATRAADNGLFVAYLNAVGGQDELVFDGGSIICGPDGSLLARGPAFAEALIIADLELGAVLRHRLRDPRFRKSASPAGGGAAGAANTDANTAAVPILAPARQRPDRKPLAVPPINPLTEPLPDPVGEVYQALVTGTRDYVRKSGFGKTLVGLSGGVDSALTTVIAADALGVDNVVGVTMPSRYSSEGSVADSQRLADNLGIALWRIPIEPAHQAFAELLAPWFADTEPNTAEENVQARIRGNILMSISNKFNWLVLTTGNKSELAMGYATLYGDMAGGFAVLKDVPKTLVYELCRWRNGNTANDFAGNGDSGARPIIPQAILDKPPSAELRPGQTDQDTLPPYELLDPIIKAYVEDDYDYAEMVAMGHQPEWVRQVIAAVDRNEYKRRQAPPGVKITPRAFGKDRRLPIVNRYRPNTG